MELSEIQEMWTKDCEVDRSELGEASLRIPTLHNKYYKIYSAERAEYRKQEALHKRLLKYKHEWYAGIMSKEDLAALKWEPNPLKILRSDMNIYFESDKDIIKMKSELDDMKEKVEYLEAIIKSMATRNFVIKAAIDWERFKVGA